jgi:hypothetical protein
MTKNELTAYCGDRYLPREEKAGMPVSAETWNNATMEAKIMRRQSKLLLLKLALPFTLTSPGIPRR